MKLKNVMAIVNQSPIMLRAALRLFTTRGKRNADLGEQINKLPRLQLIRNWAFGVTALAAITLFGLVVYEAFVLGHKVPSTVVLHLFSCVIMVVGFIVTKITDRLCRRYQEDAWEEVGELFELLGGDYACLELIQDQDELDEVASEALRGLAHLIKTIQDRDKKEKVNSGEAEEVREEFDCSLTLFADAGINDGDRTWDRHFPED